MIPPRKFDENADGVPIPKASTGVRGIDAILQGGLPRGRTSLVHGGPGAGKTVFGLEFLYRGALAGEPGVFVTFEEGAEAVRRNARAMGWDLDALERDDRLRIVEANLPAPVVRSGEFDLGGLLAILGGESQAIGARRIVIDAIDVLLRVFPDRSSRERQLFALHDWLLQRELTALLTVKNPARGDAPFGEVLDYMVDCVLRLDQRIEGQIATRRLRVLKYRGSGFLSNEFPFLIEEGGLVLMPVSRFDFGDQPLGERFATGVRGLDALLGGGIRRGASVIVAGGTGTGKTTFACTLAKTACDRGERVVYVAFEESLAALSDLMSGVGIGLGPAIEAKRLTVLTAMPEAMGAEEHLLRIFHSIEEVQPEHVVVDAVSACRRMGSPKAAFEFVVRLLTHCKARGVTSVFLSGIGLWTAPGDGGDLTSLVDVIIVLDQLWTETEHRRRLLVAKVRGSRHSHVYHSFHITDEGIKVEAVPSRGEAADEEETQ